MAEEILNAKPILTLHPRQIMLGKRNELLQQLACLRREDKRAELQKAIDTIERQIVDAGYTL